MISDCTGLFECNSGMCVPAEYQCDWADDCGDNSDEAACDQHECEPWQFR